MKINKKIQISFIAIVLSATLGGIFSYATLEAQTVNEINISAYLVNNQNKIIPNGDYEIRFALYLKDRETVDAYPSNSDNAVWQEAQTVTMSDGFLNAYLGQVNPLPANVDFSQNIYYLGIRIGQDSEMVPRKRVGAVPLSVSALNVRGAVPGTVAGNILLLGANGKVDVAQLPTGTSSSSLVLGNNAKLNTVLSVAGGYGYLTVSNHKITLSQVDLTADVSGILPVANGGTNADVLGLAGTLAYSDGEKYAFTDQGASGQVLLSGGSGSPVWGVVTGGFIAPDSLDFDQLADAMTLDANLAVGATSNNYSINFDSNTLFIDTQNNRVGIGTAAPAQALGVAGNAVVSGTLEASSLIINGGATIGTIGTLGLSISMNSSLVPSTTGLNLGSSEHYWSNLYVDNLSVGLTNMNGTSSEYFAINTDASEEQTMGLRFYRSVVNGYSALVWNKDSLRFNLFKRENTSTLADLSLNTLSATGAGDNYFAGNVGIGTATPSQMLHVVGSGYFTTGSYIGADSTNNLLSTSSSGAGSTTLYIGNLPIATAGSGGSVYGTTNYVSKFTSATALGNSSIFDNGNVGIGTTDPGKKLEIVDAANSQLRLSQTSGSLYTDFQVAATTGDLTVKLNGTNANDIILSSGASSGANLSVCEGAACPTATVADGGNLILERAAIFAGTSAAGAPMKIKPTGTANELGVYDSAGDAIIIFDNGSP
jgi:hypothetical protein